MEVRNDSTMRWEDLLIGLRRTTVIALVSLLVIPSASAVASDPLLSGYGGPGGGEQVLISTKVLPPESGDGSLRQQPSSATPTTSSGKPTAKRKKQPSGGSAKPAKTGSKPTYPREASTASALPLAQGDALMLSLGACTVGLIAFGLRRYRSAGK